MQLLALQHHLYGGLHSSTSAVIDSTSICCIILCVLRNVLFFPIYLVSHICLVHSLHKQLDSHDFTVMNLLVSGFGLRS